MAKKKRSRPMPSPLRLATIENPDWRPDREGEMAFPRFVQATVDIRESAIETLYARKFLALSQKRAADRFREIWETAGGRVASLDLSSDRVDGGRSDPAIGRLRAAQELTRCRNLIGVRGYEALQAVCGEGKSLPELSPHKRTRLTMADNLRADLDDLAVMWGMQTRRRFAS